MATAVENVQQFVGLLGRGFLFFLRPKRYVEKYRDEATNGTALVNLFVFAAAASAIVIGPFFIIASILELKFNIVLQQASLAAVWIAVGLITAPGTILYVYVSSHRLPSLRNLAWVVGQMSITSALVLSLVQAVPNLIMFGSLADSGITRMCSPLDYIRNSAECMNTMTKGFELSARTPMFSGGYAILTYGLTLWSVVVQARFLGNFFGFPSWRYYSVMGWFVLVLLWFAALSAGAYFLTTLIAQHVPLVMPEREYLPERGP